ncbi:IS4 family transposase [Legionella waltersii]|nr:IS4 family transposase [Legionella waltersii]SNV08639.1 transposase [Legionella waltersii]
MQQMPLLHKEFEKELPFVHKTRLDCLMKACNTAANNNTLFLTGLGRKDPSPTKTSSNIEKVNRLLGNEHLHKERPLFYQAMACRLIPSWMNPWIHVDWSCINPTTNLYLLRASISVKGRSIVLYEECHPKKKENNHVVHKQFLKNLKAILPSCATPIIVTDGGFRAPWFMAVREMGWNFVGRLRNKNLVLTEDAQAWQLSSLFFEQATGKPAHLGHALLTEEKQVPVDLVLYKGKSKHRHQRNLNKKIAASGKSKKHSKAAKEPWLLVTSLAQARDNPNHIVNIYRQRMRIEENFRDTKCPHYGLGLKDSLTRAPQRMDILLLIAAIATFAAWLAGILITHQGKAADFQAHSAKFTSSLSIVYLGREVIKKQMEISNSDLILALQFLLQMVINTQLEHGVYD